MPLVERLGVRRSAFAEVGADELSGEDVGGQVLFERASPVLSLLPVACDGHRRCLLVAVKAAQLLFDSNGLISSWMPSICRCIASIFIWMLAGHLDQDAPWSAPS